VVFLIDAYNLMHAAGVVGRTKTGSLKSARRRLLDWLADGVRSRADTLRVIFDGQTAPADSGEETYCGLQVKFAFRATADDAIEAELAGLPRRGAVVVSDDTRLHEAARRRGCEAWGCARFVDWLIEPPKPKEAVPIPNVEKPTLPGGDEELLKAFATPKLRGRK
jgi:predicted RNA-binding protein with PIN domain